MSQYPDFNREVIDTDETQKYFATSSSFPSGYKCVVQDERPEPHHQAAYSHGGAQGTIYAMLYTFYEDIYDYGMAELEFQKKVAERELEQTQRQIKKKDDEIMSNSNQGGGISSNGGATTVGTMSISSHFQSCKHDNVSNLKK